MFNLICRCNLANLGISLRIPQTNALSSHSLSFSSEPKIYAIKSSYTVDYLMNSCGFSQETALRASKRMKIKPDRADSVVTFFKNYGFTQTQIFTVVKIVPRILVGDPEKTFMPKFEFLSSIGFLSTDIARVITVTPEILETSLENKIIPSYNFFRDLLKSDEKTIRVIKRSPTLLSRYIHENVVQNIECLQELGVPESNLTRFITHQPANLLKPSDKFREIVEEVKKMGFDPLRGNFLWAIQARGSMSKSLWEKKVEIYNKWGLSEEEIYVAFGKTPWFMQVSEKKIERVMDFLITKMGMKSSIFKRIPALISSSLEKRIVPRLLFRKILVDRGLINEEDFGISSWLTDSEKDFIKKIRKKFVEEAPQVLKLYQSKMDSANDFS